MLNNKLKIAVSSCLLGESVRYDGTHKHIEYITQHLAKEFCLISLCPEVAVGMGVPRPPVHLVEVGERIEVLGINNTSCNMTQPLTEYADKIVNNYFDICGYIFKKNSPSCGPKDVKVLNKNGDYEKKGQGMYAAAIIKALPMLPVIDEEDLMVSKNRDDFLSAVIRYSEMKNSYKHNS